MKKLKKKSTSDITLEEGLKFLEDIRLMAGDIQEPTKPISIRVPANLLRTLKLKAKMNHTKYQTLIIDYIREGLRK